MSGATTAAAADRTICVLGMGYVGLTLAAAFADVGFGVLGVEIRDDVLAALARGEPHVFEPGLAEKMRRATAAGTLSFARHVPPDWRGTVFVITVGTPLDAAGRSRMDMVQRVAAEVASALKANDLVIMRSTVKLGATRSVVVPMLDRAGVPYDLAFCPERTLEGNALAELRQLPQIVGGMTAAATARAAAVFQSLTPTVVHVSDVETAEMIKLVDNAQRDVAFAYSNEIARACDAVGVSAIEVIEAGKTGYPRTNLPIPGPVGGPCLEKDSYIFAEALRDAGIDPEMTMAARVVNERQPREIAEHLARVMTRAGAGSPCVITLLGIAFKGRPATNDLRGTMAISVLDALRACFPDASYRAYDAVVAPDEIRALGLSPCSAIEGAMSGAQLALIVNNHPVFAAMPISGLAARMARPGLIYDFWNTFRAGDLHLPDGIGYMALGSHGRAVLPSRNA
ncbi:MAG TPA: nucleotide sugar dehydrogenase [Gemmatimonadaceae bacterium]|jgi:nucleotide sugar dehydrogenase|nr:nucleotide sugar dehydrogenase [Gemmatimonadaceae bacterium]